MDEDTVPLSATEIRDLREICDQYRSGRAIVMFAIKLGALIAFFVLLLNNATGAWRHLLDVVARP